MKHCETCTCEDVPPCEAAGCGKPAEFTGWHRAVDGMGLPTGLVQKRNFCSDHMSLFVGHESIGA